MSMKRSSCEEMCDAMQRELKQLVTARRETVDSLDGRVVLVPRKGLGLREAERSGSRALLGMGRGDNRALLGMERGDRCVLVGVERGDRWVLLGMDRLDNRPLLGMDRSDNRVLLDMDKSDNRALLGVERGDNRTLPDINTGADPRELATPSLIPQPIVPS